MEMSGLRTAGTRPPAPAHRAFPILPARPAQQEGSLLQMACSVRLYMQESSPLRARSIVRRRVPADAGIPAPGICGRSHGSSRSPIIHSSPDRNRKPGGPGSLRGHSSPGRHRQPGGPGSLRGHRKPGGPGSLRGHGRQVAPGVPGIPEGASFIECFPSQSFWPRCSFFFSSVGGF